MNFKNITLAIFVSIFSFNFACAMKLEISSKDTKLNRGEEIFLSFARCYKSEDLGTEKKEHLINNTVENSLKYAFFKAKYSVKGISDKLNDTPYIGKIVPNLEGLASALFKFDTVIEKEAENIKKDGVTTLKDNFKNKMISEDIIKNKEDKVSMVWFNKPICISDNNGHATVNYLEEDIKLEDFEKDNKELCFDMLCFITNFAKENKEFFVRTIDKGFNPKVKKALKWVFLYDNLCAWFHTKLSDPKSNIEGEIRGNLFPEEVKNSK